MHILEAHSAGKEISYTHEVEITALAFDESLRMLISGGHDGTVAIWNFNNGIRFCEIFYKFSFKAFLFLRGFD